ncbi:MAG: 16S rRNA (uracil(1498)-N(3))-methyltransferase [Holosporaceae bacterium]|jgi:16S rRNA (uracil1498-N3)-methyltransferase|nr:16S rRNA (uracil(1498)-N(3))-methyltransferase [Holosporaceae bacterium]
MKHIPRFYKDADLGENRQVLLSPDQTHHAANVLRLAKGNPVRVFNSRCGEWNCEIFDPKKGCVEIMSLFRKNEAEEGPIIACSLINPKRFDFFLEKATELGISEIIPIVSAYTQYREFNVQKAEQKIILACEQCGRLSVPGLNNIMKISDFLEKYSHDYQILVGDNKYYNISLFDIITNKSVFLVGPEGGFSGEEYNLFDTYKNVSKFRLGNNILKTETAAVAFASLWKSCFF